MNERMRQILSEIESKRTKARALLSENKKVEAKALMEEIKELRSEYEIEAELYEDEKKNVLNKNQKTKKEDADPVTAFNKAVLGKPMSDAESKLVEKTKEDGGYLVPEEISTQITELKRSLPSLKDYCNVIPVTTLSGHFPIEVASNDMLINFSECEEINQSDIKFGNVAFNLSDWGDIVPVSNTLLQDEKANLMSFIDKRFAKKAVRLENSKILEVIKSTSNKNADGKNIDDINNAIIDMDPELSKDAVIVTNQDGYKFLSKQKDKDGRYLLTDSVVYPGAQELFGKKIIVVKSSDLPSLNSGTKTDYYIVNFAEAVAFFDREVYEVAKSSEAGFTKYATLLRCIERFDVKAVDKEAVKLVQVASTEE